MANPVWILSVDLQTKTATFQSGMAEAARSARSAFQDIGSSAEGGSKRAASGVMNVRASLGLLDNTIRGNHAAAMADLVHLFSQSQIVMAALPFTATVGGFLLLGGVILGAVNYVRELKEAQEKLGRSMTDFDTAAQNAFNGLDQKILEAAKRADELRNDHLAALAKELKLIDMQSMGELEKNFDELAKKTDVVFGQLQSHWYTFGIGTDGAKHALEVFKSQYDSLLSKGDSSGAASLLSGTLAQAEKVLALQKEAQANDPKRSATGAVLSGNAAAHAQSLLELSRFNVSASKDEVTAQEALVALLRDAQTIQEKSAALKKEESSNAAKETGNAAAGRTSEAQRNATESMLRMGQQAIQADRAVAEAQLNVKRASIAERLRVDMDFAARERDVQTAANDAEIAALDKSGKDYSNQLAAAKEKALEITQQYNTRVAELQSKASTEAAAKDIRDLEESIREKIAATTNGEAQRLAVVNAALKAEEARNLQDTSFYRELLTQKADITRQMAEEELKRQESAGKQTAEDIRKNGALMLEAEKASLALRNSTRRATDQQLMGQNIILAQQEYAIKQQALQQEIAALDRGGKDYQNKLKELQNQERQLVQQHENEITQIKQKAEEARNMSITSAARQAETQLAQGLTQSIMGHQTWAHMLTAFASQAAEGLIKNSLLVMAQQNKERLSYARSAAAAAYATGEKIGGPAGLVLGPVFGAAAFAGVMAFEGGGIVPGFGHGDIVPAMLAPGETVIPKNMTDLLQTAARNGDGSHGGNHYHIQAHFAPHVHAMDADGVDRVLDKHADKFQKHFDKALRRTNK